MQLLYGIDDKSNDAVTNVLDNEVPFRSIVTIDPPGNLFPAFHG